MHIFSCKMSINPGVVTGGDMSTPTHPQAVASLSPNRDRKWWMPVDLLDTNINLLCPDVYPGFCHSLCPLTPPPVKRCHSVLRPCNLSPGHKVTLGICRLTRPSQADLSCPHRAGWRRGQPASAHSSSCLLQTHGWDELLQFIGSIFQSSNGGDSSESRRENRISLISFLMFTWLFPCLSG